MEEYTQITLDQWTQWKEDIRRKLSETASNFVYIGYRLKQIRDSGMYDGAEDIFEFAQKEYGLGKSTVSRFIAINEKYSEGGNSLELKEEFRSFSSSKLAEMLTLPDSEIQMITEKTTIREIRDLKTFNNQTPEEAAGEEKGIEAAGNTQTPEWSPLEKCLIDFFKERREMLNEVMKHLEAEQPNYKQASELMAPSGQASHKKGIVFLFMYEWDRGIKYKLMTAQEPVSMDWPEFLNTVYHIFGACDQADVWKDFYGEQEEDEKPKEAESIQGKEESVATSQQEDVLIEKTGQQEAAKQLAEEPEIEEQEAAGVENKESGENKEETKTCADSGQTGEHSDDPEPADEASGAIGGAGEDSAAGREDGESGTGEQDAGVTEEPEKHENTQGEAAEAAGQETPAIADSEGMKRHIENQEKIIIEELQTMRVRCIQHNWDSLIERAKNIITRAESIKNMEEMWNE